MMAYRTLASSLRDQRKPRAELQEEEPNGAEVLWI